MGRAERNIPPLHLKSANMKIQVLLNRHAGSLKTIDADEFADYVREAFVRAGHKPDVRVIDGSELESALDAAATDDQCEVIGVCGGDGSVSCAAGVAWRSGKALAIIPAGTMNLFARSLGTPLDLHDAVDALAEGRIRDCDIASVNDRAFVHQFSVGLHPQMVESRQNYPHHSRVGKILASVRGAFDAFRKIPRVRADITLDGEAVKRKVFGVISCSNNRYGVGHIPFADHVDKGELGVYLAPPMRPKDSLVLAADTMLGKWNENALLEERSHKRADIRFSKASGKIKCAIDGELCPLPQTARIRIHAGELKVLVPFSP